MNVTELTLSLSHVFYISLPYVESFILHRFRGVRSFPKEEAEGAKLDTGLSMHSLKLLSYDFVSK